MPEDLNKNFLDNEWWKTATVEDVEAEIAKGADVNYKENSVSILAYALSQFHNDNDDVVKDIIKILLENGAKYDSSIDKYWKSAPEDIYKLLKEKFGREPNIEHFDYTQHRHPIEYQSINKGKIKEALINNPKDARLEHTVQIGGWGNPNFPVMGWGNKSYDKNPDDEDFLLSLSVNL